MKKQFNLARYKELLKLEEINKCGFSFSDKGYLKLLGYIATIEGQISYNWKENYFSLIGKYLTRVIVAEEFESNSFEIILLNYLTIKA